MDGVINGELSEESPAEAKENDTPMSEESMGFQNSCTSEMESETKVNVECVSYEKITTNAVKDDSICVSPSVSEQSSTDIHLPHELPLNDINKSVVKENGLHENSLLLLETKQLDNIQNSENSSSDIKKNEFSEQNLSSELHVVSELQLNDTEVVQTCSSLDSASAASSAFVKLKSECSESSFKTSFDDENKNISTDLDMQENIPGSCSPEVKLTEEVPCDLSEEACELKETSVNVSNSVCTLEKNNEHSVAKITEKISPSSQSDNVTISPESNMENPLNFSISSISATSVNEERISDISCKLFSRNEPENYSALPLIKGTEQSSEIPVDMNSCSSRKSVSEDNSVSFSSPGCSFPHVNMKPIEYNESNYNELNPLEKLNEHLNSII